MKFRKIDRQVPSIDTALVLSGGGAKGAYQIGVIQELFDRGIKIDLVTGSSIGAFNGALLVEFINSGMNTKQIGSILAKIWRELDNFLVLNWSGFLYNFFNPFRIPSIFSNKMIKRTINKYIPINRLFNHYTECQLSVTGTNLNKKELRIFDFNSGIPVRKAVLASLAFPVGLPAVDIEGDRYVDGGTLDNAPLKEAILWGAKRIFVVFLQPLHVIDNHSKKRVNDNFPALKVVQELIELASNKMMYGDLKRAEEINKIINLINRYEQKLPNSFSDELKKLYGFKSGDSKRVVKITKIAPFHELEPPGLIGFKREKDINQAINRGIRDTRMALTNPNK